MKRIFACIGCVAVAASLAGCAAETTTEPSATVGKPSPQGVKYLLSDAPPDAQDVISMRESVEDEQPVTVIGRIGGSHEPWVEGLAAFSVVDRSLAACTDIPGDTCPTPWDYCCVTDRLPGATTLVKLVDESGEVVPTDARELLGVRELQTVVVEGTAQKDESGNVTVLARGIYVDPANPGQVKSNALAGDGHEHEEHEHDHEHDAHDHGDEPETSPESKENGTEGSTDS